VVRTSLGLGCLSAATVMALLGLGLCLWAAYQWLSHALGPIGGALIIGAAALSCSAGLVWLAIRLGR
jgi:hypothetical protein